MKRTRIILAVTNDISTDRRVQRTASTLSEAGAEVIIIGQKKRNSPAIDRNNFRIIRLSVWFKKSFLFYAEINLRLFIRLLFIRADIITANDLDTLVAVYLACILQGAVPVYDSHEFFTEVPELIHRPLVRGVWKKIERVLVPRIKYASTVSGSIARAYENLYGVPFTVIRNVPESHELPAPYTLSGYRAGIPLILYQGSVNIGRGLEELIEAMVHLSEGILVIAGDGDILQSLKTKTTILQLGKKVIFTGRLKPGELLTITRMATLGVSLEKNTGLNYYYALPNKLFDYFMAGVPVLVSALPEMKQIVEFYDTGCIIEKVEPVMIASALQRMLNSKEDYVRWKSNTMRAAKDLCWEKEKFRLLELYQKAGLKQWH